MGTVSCTLPWLLDLDDDSVDEVLRQLQSATLAPTRAEAIQQIDAVVAEWEETARKRREYAEEKARRKLQDAIDEERRKRMEAEKANERLHARLDELKEREQEREESLNNLRELMRHRRDMRVKIDPHDIALFIGWHTR